MSDVNGRGEHVVDESAEVHSKRQRKDDDRSDAQSGSNGRDENGVEEEARGSPGRERGSKRQKGDGNGTTGSSGEYKHAVHLRGLPWNASTKDVAEFLSPLEVEEGAIHLVHNSRGEAYVKFTSESSLEAALKKDRNMLGRRYIEVFRSSVEDVAHALDEASSRGHGDGDFRGVVRMRGLPWSANEGDIRKFFDGLPIEKDGVHVTLNRDGRPSGEAYVVFETEANAKDALKRDKDKIGERWIDIFEATKGEVYSMTGGGRQRDQSGVSFDTTDSAYTGVVRMRGLPFEATKPQIRSFFGDIAVKDSNIFIVTRPDGKASGDAFVLFATEAEAEGALAKDKEKLGDRWIDLFPTNKGALYQRVGVGVKMAAKPDAEFRGVLRMRGLPFTAGVEEIRTFFRGYKLQEHGVFVVNGGDWRPTGESYVLFDSEEEAERAFKALDKQKIGDRWIELFRSTKGDLYTATVRSTVLGMERGGAMYGREPMTCVKLRGLPFNVTENNIFSFFQGLTVIGSFICKDVMARPTGEGFVEFASVDDCQLAMSRNRESMMDRYVEVFATSKEDVLQQIGASGAGSGVGRGGAGGGGGGYGGGNAGRGGGGYGGAGGGGGGGGGYGGFNPGYGGGGPGVGAGRMGGGFSGGSGGHRPVPAGGYGQYGVRAAAGGGGGGGGGFGGGYGGGGVVGGPVPMGGYAQMAGGQFGQYAGGYRSGIDRDRRDDRRDF
ncbi:unnamed protein product, partial [Laminaria digitata]